MTVLTAVNYFRKKSSIVDVLLSSKYAYAPDAGRWCVQDNQKVGAGSVKRQTRATLF